MSRTPRAIESYIVPAPAAHKTSLDAYSECPAKAFLVYVSDAADAFSNCLSKFAKKPSGGYTQDSQDSLRHIECALLGALMGGFETYQKALFAGMLERTGLFPDFDEEAFVKSFDRRAGGEIQLAPTRLMAYRAARAPVGNVFADSIQGWHNPARVNTFFHAFGLEQRIFSEEQVEDLMILWQLRHSIVHTGAWMTPPDAHKLRRLRKLAGQPLAFEAKFISAICRRLHGIVRDTNKRLHTGCQKLLGPEPATAATRSFADFLAVGSTKEDWLREREKRGSCKGRVRPTYTKDFKEKMLRLSAEGHSAKELAAKFGVSSQSIWNWLAEERERVTDPSARISP